MLFSLSNFLLCTLFPFLMAYAAASDLLTMKISNRVTLSVVAGFALYALASGMAHNELVWHVAAGALTLTVAFGMFARGWVGGGDAKLAAGIALWLGFADLVEYLIAASLLGGALTLSILYIRSYPLPKTTINFDFAVRLHDNQTGIPYGIALSAAALLVMPQAAIWNKFVLI